MATSIPADDTQSGGLFQSLDALNELFARQAFKTAVGKVRVHLNALVTDFHRAHFNQLFTTELQQALLQTLETTLTSLQTSAIEEGMPFHSHFLGLYMAIREIRLAMQYQFAFLQDKPLDLEWVEKMTSAVTKTPVHDPTAKN